MVDIQVIGTERFHLLWDRNNHDSNTYVSLVNSYVESVWNDYIPEGIDYVIDVEPQFSWDIEIPESELPLDSEGPGRLEACHDWLNDNHPPYSNIDIWSAIVLDWYSSHSSRGMAYIGTAGREDGWIVPQYRVGWVEASKGTSGNLHSNVGSRGTALHELLHTFNCLHEDGATYDNTDYDEGDCSHMLVTSELDDLCEDKADWEVREEICSSCSIYHTRTHIDYWG